MKFTMSMYLRSLSTKTTAATPASQDSLTTILSLLTDVHDAQLGTWSVDKTQDPKVMTFKRLDGTVLATFQVNEDASSAARTATT